MIMFVDINIQKSVTHKIFGMFMTCLNPKFHIISYNFQTKG